MSRRMWPYEAEVKFNVRATYKQAGAWGYAANIKGLRTPVFLALAADVYAEHLERVHARWKRADERRKAREAQR
jgi:hypothetical protein